MYVICLRQQMRYALFTASSSGAATISTSKGRQNVSCAVHVLAWIDVMWSHSSVYTHKTWGEFVCLLVSYDVCVAVVYLL